MDMNSVFFLKTDERTPKWRVVDCKGIGVGRVATMIADALRGKDRATFTPHADGGDYVVVINTDHLVFTGNKLEDKKYEWHTGWIGNLKSLSARQVMEKDSTRIVENAVKGMLPKNKLSRQLLNKLKIYKGAEHPHAAQVATYPE